MAGVSPPKRGRPKKDEAVVRIRLNKHIYDMWTAKKDSLGLSMKTHSEFAEYLLMSTREGPIQTPSHQGKSKYSLSKSHVIFTVIIYGLFVLCRIFLQFINFVYLILVRHSHVQYTSTPAVEQSRRKATRLFEDSLSTSSLSDVDG